MNIKKLVLCIVITMVFSFGLGNISVLADEAHKNNELNTSELETSRDSEEIEEVLHMEEDVEHKDEDNNIIEVAKEENTKSEKSESKKTSEKKVKATKTSEKKVEETYTKSELRLLSALVYAEAGNQEYKGKLAVANIVLNRVDSKSFWHVDTIKEVIYDSKWGVQFSVIKKNSKGSSPLTRALNLYDNLDEKKGGEVKQMEEAIKAAKAALNGENNIGSYLYFSRTSNYLKNKYSNHTIIEDHLFYNTK